jgi:tRNA(Ile)-lysidine synthase TilS/MesJ
LDASSRDRQLVWREDASNRSPRYARNRLRNDWLPGLAGAFNPRLLRAIGDLAEAQSRDSEWIAAQVARESERRFSVEEAWLHIDAKDWAMLPEALGRRLAREALIRAGAGRHASRVHLARIGKFLSNALPGTRIELPGSLELVRDRAGYRLGPLPDTPTGGLGSAC